MLHSHLTTLNAVSLVLSTFKAEGLPAEALLAGSGICAADLSRADTRIATHQEMQVCANAVALQRDIGLIVGRRMHVSAYGMLGYALLTSATFGDALRLALRYPALLGTLFELSLEQDGERIWFTASDYRESPALTAFNVELCLGSLKVICDDLLGHPLPLLGARFEHAAPDYQARYAECFDCPLQFQATANAFAFDQRWLAQPLPLADTVTHRAMAERCASTCARCRRHRHRRSCNWPNNCPPKCWAISAAWCMRCATPMGSTSIPPCAHWPRHIRVRRCSCRSMTTW